MKLSTANRTKEIEQKKKQVMLGYVRMCTTLQSESEEDKSNLL